MKKKLLLSIVGICGLLFTVISCDKEKMRTPEPEKNPLILSAEAQTVDFRVSHIITIQSDDKYMEDTKDNIGNVIAKTIRYGDWLEVYYNRRQGKKENQIVKITVTANESAEPRSFTFKLNNNIKDMDFTVTQEGKK